MNPYKIKMFRNALRSTTMLNGRIQTCVGYLIGHYHPVVATPPKKPTDKERDAWREETKKLITNPDVEIEKKKPESVKVLS